jgi:hypothetical protein
MNYFTIFLSMIAMVGLSCGAFALLVLTLSWTATKIEQMTNPFRVRRQDNKKNA